jgi:hypothetical protein
MDPQRVIVLCLLDIFVAFDTINHSVLLHRPFFCFGITGILLYIGLNFALLLGLLW